MSLAPGVMLKHYRLAEKLGQGGMGVVWRARDTLLERDVAIKVLSQEVAADAERLRRFRDEARTLASLNHPNIVTIHSVEETGGVPFFTMELIEGSTLDHHIPPTGLPLERLVELARPVADALGAAHGRGVTHRDLKPGNVMVASDGRVKVLDFGLARTQAEEEVSDLSSGETHTVTSEGAVKGTLPFMSPEQMRGRTVDRRSDLFSFGIMLYRMATGRAPFEGESAAEIISATLRDTPAPVTNHNAGLPARLAHLVERCLEKSPEDRYQSCAELLRELDALGEEGHPPASGEPSIAVLPFADMSPGRDQDYFCEGMAEEIINALTKLRGLHVASRTSSFQFKEAAADSREIGRRLGVGSILEGSVRKAGKRLRITAQLVDAADGYHLWSERYDRDLEDVFAIQDEISAAIVEKLEVRLLSSEPARTPRRSRTPDLEAYSLNLKGRFFWNKRTEEGIRKGIAYFEKAVEKDPSFAPAHASIADSHALLCAYQLDSPESAIPRAREAAARALELDPELAEGHEALGHVGFLHDWDWEESEARYRRALELNPGFATAHQRLALLLGLRGETEKAEASVLRAQQLDPLSMIINTDRALVNYVAGRYREAERQCRAVLEMSPRFGVALFVLGLVYERLGRHEESIERLEEALRVSGALSVMLGALGHAYGSAGRESEARRTIEELHRASEKRYVSPYSLATVFAGLGDRERALESLERAVGERSVWLVHLHMAVDPRLGELRSDSRFAGLLEKMSLT